MAVSEDDKKPVRMGLVFMSPVHMAFYIFLVVLGVVGNATLMTVIGKSIRMDRGGGRNSDIIIVNMALSNLLVSLMRNLLLILSDFGLQVCQGLRWQISRLQTEAVCALLFFFTDVLLQRVVPVPHGCLGVVTVGQRVVNTLS